MSWKASSDTAEGIRSRSLLQRLEEGLWRAGAAWEGCVERCLMLPSWERRGSRGLGALEADRRERRRTTRMRGRGREGGAFEIEVEVVEGGVEGGESKVGGAVVGSEGAGR